MLPARHARHARPARPAPFASGAASELLRSTAPGPRIRRPTAGPSAGGTGRTAGGVPVNYPDRERWRALSAWLDELLDADPLARAARVATLRGEDPALA